MRGRVLVADDSSEGRRMISNILSCLGLEVAVAENGRVACDAALSAWKGGHPFDLILMDLQMPQIDGYEATALLRSRGYAGRIVALLSDCAFFGTHEKWMNAGCDGHAAKPITFELLRNVVRRYLPRAQQPGRKISA
jgi:CheY-like chemotaxis protein